MPGKNSQTQRLERLCTELNRAQTTGHFWGKPSGYRWEVEKERLTNGALELTVNVEKGESLHLTATTNRYKDGGTQQDWLQLLVSWRLSKEFTKAQAPTGVQVTVKLASDDQKAEFNQLYAQEKAKLKSEVKDDSYAYVTENAITVCAESAKNLGCNLPPESLIQNLATQCMLQRWQTVYIQAEDISPALYQAILDLIGYADSSAEVDPVHQYIFEELKANLQPCTTISVASFTGTGQARELVQKSNTQARGSSDHESKYDLA